VATTCCAASTATGTCARCGCFEVGGGVEACGDGLFEFGSRRLRGLGRLGCACLPVTVLVNAEQFTSGQLQGYFAAQACQYLFALEYTLAFEYLPLEAVEGDGEYLTYKAFDDGDDSAHRYCSMYSCI
jgi:hypothetical protein